MSVDYIHCECGEAIWKGCKYCHNCGAEIVLSRSEVSEYQHLQVEQCSKCALKPEGGEFCAYIWCMGEIKMYPCDEFVSKNEVYEYGWLEERKDKVYKKSERYEREHKKKPARRVEINDEV